MSRHLYRDTTGGECLEEPSCGAKYPGMLQASHPKDLDIGETVKEELCFAKAGRCCYKRAYILIMKCQGFWIYQLPRPAIKNARYCGSGGTKITIINTRAKRI